MVGGQEMGLAEHRLLKGGGLASQVETIELDVVYDGQGGAFDDHGGSVWEKSLYGCRRVSRKIVNVRTLRWESGWMVSGSL